MNVAALLFAGALGLIGKRVLALEGRLRASVLDALAVLTGQLAGFQAASAFGSLTYHAGCKLLLKTEDQSRHRLITVFGTQQRTVWLIRDGAELETPLSEVRTGDVLVVQAGQVVPVDGVIRKGSASLDQHMLTGESQPVDKAEGDRVLASTLVLAGRILVEVEQTGAQTVVAHRRAVEPHRRLPRRDRAPQRAHRRRLGAAAARPRRPGPLHPRARERDRRPRLQLLGQRPRRRPAEHAQLHRHRGAALDPDQGRARARAARRGRRRGLRQGTLTLEQPAVGEIYCFGELGAHGRLGLAAGAEARQTHPIARALVARARELALPLPELSDVRYEVGYGITAAIAGRRVQVGSARFLARSGEVLPADKAERVKELQQKGHRVCFIGDGLNDTIALKAAQSSISLRGATTAATDTAQIILAGGDLRALPALFALSDEYERNARNGLILSVGAGAVCAASVFLFHIGIFTAIVLYNVSFLASIANAMLPRLAHPDPPRPLEP